MTDWPRIRSVGLSGLLVTFAEKMSEPANRAALAFRAAVEEQDWPEVSETSTSLVSTFVQFEVSQEAIAKMTDRLRGLLETRDWFAEALPAGRSLWHVPTVYGTDLAPQLEEAAEAAGLDPDEMGIGPIYAVPKLLEKHGLKMDDIGLWELNEAFACQVLQSAKVLGIPMDKLNVNGGAIALGHPIGATGARVVVTLVHEMKRRGATNGLATLCISGGMGIACAFHRDPA